MYVRTTRRSESRRKGEREREELTETRKQPHKRNGTQRVTGERYRNLEPCCPLRGLHPIHAEPDIETTRTLVKESRGDTGVYGEGVILVST